jgi:hypothetical protein
MLILKRLAVWLLETSCEVILLGLFFTVFLGFDKHAFTKDLLIYIGGIILLSVTTWYLLTTAIARALWTGQRLWAYPVIATALFFIHFEIFNVGIGGAFDPPDRHRVRAVGACIVFACTFAGSFVLRRWVQARTK